MDFERFTDSKYKNGKMGKPFITIRKGGTMSFNMAAMRRFNISDFKYVVLLYNKETKTVGILVTNDQAEDGILKLTEKKAGGFSFAAQKFFKYYGIDFSKTARYPLEHDEENGLFIFQHE